MKDILIIAHFTQVPGELGNGRFHYIAEKIDKINSRVEVVTTSFSHRTKSQRKVTDEQLKSINYQLTMLKEPGYRKNVSVKRFFSHYMFGRSLKQFLKTRKKPDVIYCSVPSLDAAKIAADYAKEKNIHFIIDIQDLWPEAFRMIFNIPLISDASFYPMKNKANYIYSIADNIISVSQTYADRALMVNKKCNTAQSIFLGTDLAYFDTLFVQNKLIRKQIGELWIVYIGTLGYSYDIYSVIDALRILKDKGFNNIKFLVMGDGPLRDKFEKYAQEKKINTEFTGRLDYNKMIGYLKSCDIAVNPIKAGSAGSIINKVGDYAAAGLPVLNMQDSPEYRELVDSYQIGLNCENGNAQDLAKKILKLINKNELRFVMGENNRKLAEEKFDRNKTYQEIIEMIDINASN
ncbi:glycosyltransferase family 4 protein [Halobacillus sp. Nhm2S1]|uniref:glycosyltransferase family 4 protein n=1 Tax=Halobacillus sp. Nhm2S1 TaxID=2866716 RepID=UPI001C73B074|nr:glycosyltransferase family 4 protein [Halobacillus sp. Nhm2S1]MBX0357723.1 glycosyltransferase family 4 protein [Halobacillus sp. Nhm2S1]